MSIFFAVLVFYVLPMIYCGFVGYMNYKKHPRHDFHHLFLGIGWMPQSVG